MMLLASGGWRLLTNDRWQTVLEHREWLGILAVVSASNDARLGALRQI